MSFEEWQQAKEIPDTQADRKQFKEYQNLLGKEAPRYYTDFQDIKYNDPEQWEILKEEAHMERVIRRAPCVLTKRKFSGYFLKPGAKHSDDFFGVGYTEDDIRLLRYHIAKQFDRSKATPRESKYGIENFDIVMKLGKIRREHLLRGGQSTRRVTPLGS